jgi:arsenite methyltransferase
MKGFSERLAGQLRRPSGLPGRGMAYVLRRANRRINRGAITRLDLGPEDSVLEIGFGGGGALAGVLRRTRGPVAGIEISDSMLAHAKRRFRRELAKGSLELHRGDVAEIPYEDASFDRVLSVNTIYFWPGAATGLAEIRRVLRPGGRLLLATATNEEMEKRAWTRHGFRIFEDSELEKLLRDAGFEEVAVERDGVRVFSSGRAPEVSGGSGGAGSA